MLTAAMPYLEHADSDIGALTSILLSMQSCMAGEFRADRDFVLEAAKHNWTALAFAAGELRADRDFVLETANQNWTALAFAAVVLRVDGDSAWTATSC